jgi:hypothetical protein
LLGPGKHAFLTREDGVFHGVRAEELQMGTEDGMDYRTEVERNSRFFVIGSCRIMTENELDCEKKNLHVL